MRRLSKAAAGPRDALADSVRRIRQLRILALKKELEDRLANAAKLATDGDAAEGRPWRNILADLNSLTGTEGEQDGKRFLLRSAPPPAASLAPRPAGVAPPPNVRRLAKDWSRPSEQPNLAPRRSSRATSPD
jgi:hypothetical protein